MSNTVFLVFYSTGLLFIAYCSLLVVGVVVGDAMVLSGFWVWLCVQELGSLASLCVFTRMLMQQISRSQVAPV